MTNKERELAALGFHYAEGIEEQSTVIVPATGRHIKKVVDGWECQPWNDNYWKTFDNLIAAIKFATPPTTTKAIS